MSKVTLEHPDNRGEVTEAKEVLAKELDYQRAERKRAERKVHKVQADEVEKERRRRHARRTVDAEEAAEASGDAAARIADLWMDRDQLDASPGLEPLLGTLLFRRSLVVLAGAPGSFKSFVALDWAATVATGTTWQGRGAVRGSVLYLAGEGDAGFPKRLRAWELENNKGNKVTLQVFPRPAALHRADDAETEALLTSIIERSPDLVIVDTLARYAPGMNENSAQEMGQLVANLSRIKDETGACVVVVHHTARDGGNERGSTALRGASDALYMMARPNKDRRTVEFTIDRAKEEASGGDPIKLALEVVDTPLGSSLVIPHGNPITDPLPVTAPEAMPTRKSTNLVKLLWNVYVHMRVTSTGWTEGQIRALVKASDLNLGKNERQRWPETWGKATSEGYLNRPKNGDLKETGSRWFIDVAKVREDLGFTDEAESYYKEHVLEEAPEIPDAEAA
ncbi:AAA family ATPase [Gordonia sp. SND2]|uniref:AAA family ATPase n=1 Tax=Gordonia sp. SND2 TaxID=3388659 RepID=UPI00398BA5D2